jgi:hypothetical protein
MLFLAAALKMTLPRAPTLESGVVAFSVTLRPLLMMDTVSTPIVRLSLSMCKYRTVGMTILKLTCAVALKEVPGAALLTRESVAAVSGNSNAAVLIKPLNAYGHFTIGFLLSPPLVDIDKRWRYFNEYLGDAYDGFLLGSMTQDG